MSNKSHTVPHKIDFTTFVLSVSSAAFVGLGMAPHPGSGKQEVNKDLARHNIDLLELIKDKTRGNLNQEEEGLLDHLLRETRVKFVEIQDKR
jgi:hypothetical protein